MKSKMFLLSMFAIISMFSATQVYAHPCGCGNGVVDQGEVCDGTPGCAVDCLSQTAPPAIGVCGGAASGGRICAANEICGRKTGVPPDPCAGWHWSVKWACDMTSPDVGSFTDTIESCYPLGTPNVWDFPYTP